MDHFFVARQPIFDARHRIRAYELLYRSSADALTAGSAPRETMAASTIVGGLLGMGLSRLTEGQTAFVNMPERFLMDDVHELLDPTRVVFELQETTRPTPEVVEKCRQLKSLGFRLALDNFVYDEAYLPLLDVVDVVKIDVPEAGSGLEESVGRLKAFDFELLAEKVENQETHERCVELGFGLFQGFHYFRPVTLTQQDLGAGSASIVRLLAMLNDPNVSDRALEEAFRSDPSLSYKLLRIVNSAALGGRGVNSIGHAMRMVGRDPLHRWLSLLLLTVGGGGGEMRTEMIKSALERGRMCELIGDQARTSFNRDFPDSGSLFLVGLFSHLDALLGVPMEKILEDIDVAREVREALLGYEGKAGRVLDIAIAYTDADWDRAEEELRGLGMDPSTLGDLYLDSVAWAGAHMGFHDSED